MKLNRLMNAAAFVVLALLLVLIPASAQNDELPVLILPVDNAAFLPGAKFDFRVEVHGVDALPENFAVTVNGTPAAEFFGAEGTNESWEFGGNVAKVVAEGTPAADFSVDTLAGDYYNSSFGKITVVVEDGVITGTLGADELTLDATDEPLAFTVTGGAADGMTLTFGLDADGKVTGFNVAGQDFGVLTTLPTKSQSVIWRELTAPAAGEYVVEVTAGATVKSVTWDVRAPQAGSAKNVILFVADGMTTAQLTAARAARGITQGLPNNPLHIDSFTDIAFASTSSVDSLLADSANTASALNTGHIGSVNATGSYSDTSPDKFDDPRTETLAQMLKRLRGMSIGVVTTADFSDATPAAVWAHGRDRSDSNRNAYLVQALESGVVDVLMGGGARRMIPQSVEGSRRTDDRDLIAEFEAAGFVVTTTATELTTALESETPNKLLGVYTPSDMNVWLDRNVYTENVGEFTDQPGLTAMTLAALEVLNTNPNGFYLEVEAASVDKQMHPLDQERALSDLIEFDEAIGAAIAWVQENAPDTLIVVTADHGHGYDVYGTVDTTKFNAADNDIDRRKAIRVYGAAGYPDYQDANGDGFPEWDSASIVFAGTVNNNPEYTEDFQVSPVPRVPASNVDGVYVDNPDDDPNGILMTGRLDPASSTGVHTLQDVPVYAMGPSSDLFFGSWHQREVFFRMAAALSLDPSQEDGTVQAAPAVTAAGFNMPLNITTVLLALAAMFGGVVIGRAARKA